MIIVAIICVPLAWYADRSRPPPVVYRSTRPRHGGQRSLLQALSNLLDVRLRNLIAGGWATGIRFITAHRRWNAAPRKLSDQNQVASSKLSFWWFAINCYITFLFLLP